jgi:hypothetical protein
VVSAKFQHNYNDISRTSGVLLPHPHTSPRNGVFTLDTFTSFQLWWKLNDIRVPLGTDFKEFWLLACNVLLSYTYRRFGGVVVNLYHNAGCLILKTVTFIVDKLPHVKHIYMLIWYKLKQNFRSWSPKINKLELGYNDLDYCDTLDITLYSIFCGNNWFPIRQVLFCLS